VKKHKKTKQPDRKLLTYSQNESNETKACLRGQMVLTLCLRSRSGIKFRTLYINHSVDRIIFSASVLTAVNIQPSHNQLLHWWNNETAKNVKSWKWL